MHCISLIYGLTDVAVTTKRKRNKTEQNNKKVPLYTTFESFANSFVSIAVRKLAVGKNVCCALRKGN